MKKFFWAILFLVGCKKTDNGPGPTVDISVRETSNNAAVEGANVRLQRCAAAGCIFGYVTEYSGNTDNNGIVKVPQDKYNNVPVWNEAILVSKLNWWPESFSKLASVSITPCGWIRLRIIRGTSYPPGSLLRIITSRITPIYSSLWEYNTPADSSVLIRAFGGHQNKIDWQVVDPSFNLVANGTWNQQVPRLDTVTATLNY